MPIAEDSKAYGQLNFKNEHYLRQAISGLFERIDEIGDVQILHGAQEYGKDVVFKIKGALGEKIECASVIKNSKISGSVDKSTGARNVLFQVSQAFDTPYVNGFGEDIAVERVYIMTPFQIDQMAINSIKGALQNHDRRIVIVDGNRLFDLFKEHWPDFIAEEQSEIDSLLSNSTKELSSDENLERLTHLYSGVLPKKRDTKKLYVEPLFHIEAVLVDLRRAIEKYLPESDFLVIPGIESTGPDDPGAPPKPITGRNRDNRIRNLSEDLSRFISYVQHLHDWDWLGTRKNKAKHIISTLNTFVESLLAALRYGQSTSGKKALLDTRGDLTYLNSKELSSIKTMVFDGLERLTDHMRLLNNLLEREGLSSENELDLLISHEFQSAQGCINSMDLPRTDDMAFFTMDIGTDLFSIANKNILLVAPAGYGKTSFCRWHALLDTESYRLGQSKTLPIYIPLHRLHSSRITSFEDILSQSPLSAFIVASDWEDVRKGKTHLRIYLDGLDEIPLEADRVKVIGYAKKGLEGYPGSHCLITARNYIHGPWLNWLIRISLSGLNTEQQFLLVSKWFEGDSDKISLFGKQIERISVLHTIMRVPLLATLTILVYMRTGRLPPSKVELYKTFVDLLCGGWDLAKGVLRDSRFGRTEKTMILCRLAGIVHASGTRSFGFDSIKKAIDLTLAKTLFEDQDILIKELLEDGIIIESGNVYEFSHFSFQEFLSAKDLTTDIQGLRIREVLRKYINGDDWWREVVNFYTGMNSNPQETARIVVDLPGINDTERIVSVLAMIDEQYPECGISEEYSHYIDGV